MIGALCWLRQLEGGGELRPRSSASAPLPVSISSKVSTRLKPSASAKRGERRLLRLEAEAGPAVLVELGQAGIGDGGFHGFHSFVLLHSYARCCATQRIVSGQGGCYG